jgi:single-strand DNA-binding protein
MAGINRVILIGNLGSKPEIKYSSNGNPLANLSVATSERWTDKNSGEKVERTEWHRVVAFGDFAVTAEKSLDKGTKVYLQGKLTTRKWQDNNGQNRYTTEIVVSGFDGVLQNLDQEVDFSSQSPPEEPKVPGETPKLPKKIEPVDHDDLEFFDDI